MVTVTHSHISHVDQIIKGYPCGITMPLLCLLENSQFAVVKYPCNQVGTQVLINEWVCNKIALQIGLPTPQIGCCFLDQKSAYGAEFEEQLMVGEASFDQRNYGLGFYSQFIPNAVPLKKSNMRSLVNIEDFWKMLLFDQIVCNVDRHPGNLLYSLIEHKFYAIDCSNVFNSQRGWTEQSLLYDIKTNCYANLELLLPTTNGEIYEYFWTYIKCSPDDILALAKQIQQLLTPNVIYQIIDSIPDDWKDYITPSQVSTMRQYLNYRISHIIDTAILIIQERRMQ